MLQYNVNPKPSGNLYPEGKIVLPKNVMTVYQSIEDRFYSRINNKEKQKIREKLTGSDKVNFIIGHFGRVSDTCYPKHLLPAFDRLCKNFPNKNIKLVFSGKKRHFRRKIISPNKNVIVDYNGVDYMDIHKYIQSVDLITSDYNSPTADWGGCLHIIEAMASGVPIMCGNYDVRIEQLGSDYPLFWNKLGSDQKIVDEIYKILAKLLNNKININKLTNKLVRGSKLFTKNKIAKQINEKLISIKNIS